MEIDRAHRILTTHLGCSPKEATGMLNFINKRLAKEGVKEGLILSSLSLRQVVIDKSLQRIPESLLPHLLATTFPELQPRISELVRHNLAIRETPEEIDQMLTQAFCHGRPSLWITMNRRASEAFQGLGLK